MERKTHEIQLKNVLLSVFAFSPLLANLVAIYPDFFLYSGRIQLALFLLYSSVTYVILAASTGRMRVAMEGLAVGFSVFAGASVAYLILVGNRITYGAISSILATNMDEVREFVSETFFIDFLILTAAFLTIVLLITQIKLSLSVRKNGAIHRLVQFGLPIGWVICISVVQVSNGVPREYFPLYEVDARNSYWKNIQAFAGPFSRLEYNFQGVYDTSVQPTVLLVIGESARRDALGLYSKELDTTPQMNAAVEANPTRIVVFDDAITSSNHTHAAVPLILSLATAAQYMDIGTFPTVIKVLASIGIQTTLLSNQPRHGNHLVSAIMSDATDRVYFPGRGYPYDGVILPRLASDLERLPSSAHLFILHLMGSHDTYTKRYPKDQVTYSEETVRGEYLNSILYTDSVLRDTFDLLMALDHEAVMIYVVDHGEILDDYNDGWIGHGKTIRLSQAEVRVPFFVAFNKAFENKAPERIRLLRERVQSAVSHDNLSHLVLGLMGAKADVYRDELDLSAPMYQAQARYVVESVGNIFAYSDSSRFIPLVPDVFKNFSKKRD